MKLLYSSFILALCCLSAFAQKPNVILIYADDLGYGDLSCYGATRLHTPNLDKLAEKGIRFRNGHSSSATCTPSRYAMITGAYPWRKNGTGVLPGDAALIVPTNVKTLPKVFKAAGYRTAIVGKWHLGLGEEVDKDWNADIKPGPNDVGFDYSFIFPATADRVPTVFLENQRVIALDPNDPIAVNYQKKIGNEPTGMEHPELLKMKSSPEHGHDQTIINGIGRIGFMTGGKMARWVDEELSYTFLAQAKQFIASQDRSPFFLYYALTEPHVPRVPATMFKGKSGLGVRGDAILQLDWTVGQIMQQVEQLGIARNTMIVFTSDNGPVLDDGYEDEAVTRANGHKPAGELRGGKYSALEGGTRVPLIISWPAEIKPAVSDALVTQVDFLRSFASLLREKVEAGHARDSEDHLKTFLGKNNTGRAVYVQQGGALSIVRGKWKYISPQDGPALAKLVNIETGNLNTAQLYDLSIDKGEKSNVAAKYPEIVLELSGLLEATKKNHEN
jgi:arylsulfatase A-like enzyme